MSAVPGIGSVVIYHVPNGGSHYDAPAFVVCTNELWNAQTPLQSLYPEPTADQVILLFLASSSLAQETATEGTGSGQFSRVSLALDLGTIDLGSVDLSNTTATNVTVPDV